MDKKFMGYFNDDVLQYDVDVNKRRFPYDANIVVYLVLSYCLISRRTYR